jgi:hypothetical protein
MLAGTLSLLTGVTTLPCPCTQILGEYLELGPGSSLSLHFQFVGYHSVIGRQWSDTVSVVE